MVNLKKTCPSDVERTEDEWQTVYTDQTIRSVAPNLGLQLLDMATAYYLISFLCKQ